MAEARSSPSRWRAYAGLLVKVVLYSWPILALVLVLQVGPEVVGNFANGDVALTGLLAPLIIAAKLWSLFVVVMLVVSSVTFWCFGSRKVEKRW
ncbi:hypothetical protein ACETK8_03405 [Brevundimonas staleyi]|uniref:Uncharacterized protein n=1 Tax=Brevundimonas staleyi TaxID=74326 RepID=A0ABW0FU95_9CAUL